MIISKYILVLWKICLRHNLCRMTVNNMCYYITNLQLHNVRFVGCCAQRDPQFLIPPVFIYDNMTSCYNVYIVLITCSLNLWDSNYAC